MKKIFSILTTLILTSFIMTFGVISVFADDFEGQGTSDAPYIISSEDDYITLSELSYDDDFRGVYFKLSDNITVDFDPISMDKDNAFAGVFDGDGNTITFLSSNETGLFEFTNGAVIKNVNVEADIEVGKSSNAFTGGIVGKAFGDTIIKNCNFYGTIINKKTTANYTAGICGYAAGDVEIDGCQNFADITCTGNYCAGVLGYADNCGKVKILNSSNNGIISGKNFTAGIAACFVNSSFEIIHCMNNAAVSGGSYVSGITNFDNNTKVSSMMLQDVINTSAITASASDAYASGIIAYSETNGTDLKIYNSANLADVTGAGYSSGIVTYWSTRNNEKLVVQNCYNSGKISGNVYGSILAYYNARPEDIIVDNFYNSGNCSKLDGNGKLKAAEGKITDLKGNDNAVVNALNANIEKNDAEWNKWAISTSGLLKKGSTTSNICFECDINGFAEGSVLSEGSLWIIISIAVLTIGAITSLVFLKKKKQ